ncbi:16S rRNA (cytidine(1402)-2'-O)-methyltransferase [Sporosarcina gallistercoris]|uniref:Ribosomal RNA small subunit methyltransferase I n=1 Tax=Sporosarcina gallistercoris TaxID=2762245 RepID=A0ABR8PMY9_9BACL|nr:16S rRNA (cytidine(1402)-2'-O)-methyltransferase [Sporosarcina gallistercoris]MBD7909538.1 16S rRNA (cytidine(1402)-2'-O)-methyltransferase [Sporosarcina gallistercoris]
MITQRSAENEQGVLYLVGTPIGNLEDMSYRAIRILKEADMIAAEDTRNTVKLSNHFEIDTPFMSYHEHNLEVGGRKILELLAEGKTVALVSDAGMPCISDPGADIAEKAIAEGYAVVPVPGPNAAISALVASGIPTQPFLFFGFLDRQKKKRRLQLELLQNRQETLLFYEAPHRLKETLRALLEQFGPDRRITLARELTKRYEEFVRGTIEEALNWAESTEIRGEFCLVVEGADQSELETEVAWWSALTLVEHVEQLMEQKGYTSKEAIRETAADRGMSKREVYQAYHVE